MDLPHTGDRDAGLAKPPLHIHLIDELKTGGAQTHLVTMLRESLSRYPYRHRAAALFGDGPIGGQLRALGIPVDVFDLRSQFARKRFFQAASLLESYFRRRRPALVEAHLTWSRLLGLYAAWRARVPLRIGFEQGDIYLDSCKFRAANFAGQRFAHRIVVCSEALGDWARRTHGISRRRLAVLHNCVDTRRFQPRANPELRGSWRFPGAPVIFAAAGTLGAGVNKRVDVLIRAVADARSRGADAALVVCGDGRQRPALDALAAELGVSGAVRFLGMRSDVADVLAACDAFCHAAPFEPFGIVCIEAMAVGLPVLAPASGGIQEAVEDGRTGFLYPALDHAALAELMIRLCGDPKTRRNIGRDARAAAERRFSVEAYLRKLYSLYGLPVDSLEPAPV